MFDQICVLSRLLRQFEKCRNRRWEDPLRKGRDSGIDTGKTLETEKREGKEWSTVSHAGGSSGAGHANLTTLKAR